MTKAATPKFTRAPDALVRAFENAMKNWPMAERRKMFGYPTAFINAQMFAGLFRDRMFLRLSETDRIKFMAEHATGPFEPVPGRPMKEYVLVPRDMLKSPRELKAWIARAMAFAASLPPKTKRARQAR